MTRFSISHVEISDVTTFGDFVLLGAGRLKLLERYSY